MPANKQKKQEPQKYKIGFYHMIRDVLIASINKGQFPLGIFGIIMIILVLKLPPADASQLLRNILSALKQGYLVGYVFAGILATGWLVHAKWQRRDIKKEMERITTMRNKLQKELGLKITSSEEEKK